ncbi:MAG: vitamin B12-dependent ribonucleotide reductase [Oscillospiraceae bacterium]|jgi:ribonucleoside-diphosphate reductase alpha chain|nr:vitamin B12-dependent ribonucleotide reductase [Oscillospiraceae bacterium]
MELSQNAQSVLEKRYLARTGNGTQAETPEDLLKRVARAVAEGDRRYGGAEEVQGSFDAFFNMMDRLEFLPNSPTLMNAGRPLGQLSACFVLPVADSMEDIFDAVKNAALIHKSGGGTGFSFSRLRPAGSAVNSTGGVASGPVSFMKVFNAATEAVKQGGTRRGANMGILRIDHPDINGFISSKTQNAEITNFNISVGITEAFMKAVERGCDYDLINPADGSVSGRQNAREIFDRMVSAAWQNGEPGIVFLDRLNRDNAVPSQGEIEATNPCGEQPLLPYESCNLGSVNLAKMLRTIDGNRAVNWEKLRQTVGTAVHFLDNVIDVNHYPLAKIDEATRATRKIGLGVMGFADMLLLLGIPYNSDEAVRLAESLMEFISNAAREKSRELAEKRGAFPLFDVSIRAGGEPVRNATVTTIAPTGTLSIIANCSSGIEPVFGFAYIRNIMDGTELTEVNPVLRQTLERRGLLTDELLRQIAAHDTLAQLDGVPEDMKQVFVSAHDISPEYHIKMQAAFQKHTDNAVSKTVNFRRSATPEDVREVYFLAYRLGCKGVTIYRDGSRSEQVLNIGKVNKENAADTPVESGFITPRPRPEVTIGVTECTKSGCGNLYITVNYDDKGICEVFTNTGRVGGCPSQSEATSRLVSVALRSGMSVESIVKQLKGIRCPSTVRQPGMKCSSCPDAIARAIEKVARAQEFEGYRSAPVNDKLAAGGKLAQDFARENLTVYGKNDVPARVCPECGSELEHEGGCVTCRGCGYSKCG